MTTIRRNGKDRSNVTDDARCAVCQGPVNVKFPVRSNTWAYGMKGVRMMLCSTPCQETFDQEQEVPA